MATVSEPTVPAVAAPGEPAFTERPDGTGGRPGSSAAPRSGRGRHARGASRAGAAERTERWVTVVVLGMLMAASVAAHDPHRMLTQPLWRDENWVAVTLRAPFSHLLSLTSTTPPLFTALLWITPHWSPSSLRLMPLAFTVAAVVPAWYLGREIEPDGWLTRVVLAAGVAFAPAMLIRHDLKQYTAEAFDALVVLWLLARLETSWSRRRLVVLGAVLAASTLLSNGAVFLAPAVFAGLALVTLCRRQLRRLVEVAVVGAATLALDLAVLIAVDQRGDTASLRVYWDAFYIPTSGGLANALHFVHFQAGAELHNVGLGPSLVAAALIVAGLVTLVVTGYPALGLVVPIVTVEQLAAAAAHRYPLWDQRTSTWYTVALTVLALVGVTGAARLAWFALHHARRRGGVALAAAGGLGLLVLVGAVAPSYLSSARTAVDFTTPLEDVHGQVQTIEAQWRSGDVIVANVDAGFGLGVYWPAQPEFLFRQARLETFRIAYPPADRIVVATTISTAAEVDAVRRAVALAGATPHGRVWVVFSHWHIPERATMVAALQQYGTLSTPAGQHGLEDVDLLALRRPLRPTPPP